MKCRNLFKNSNVVYVPAEENLHRQESKITTYANYHGFKVSMELGLWVNPANQKCERVLKISYLGDVDEPIYEPKIKAETIIKREEKIERIKSYMKKGLTMQEMARKEKCSKQAISAFIKYQHIRQEGV